MNRTDYAVVAAAVLVIFDGLMTLPFWNLEGNPVVLGLGPTGMMLVKIAASVGFVAVWFGWQGIQSYTTARTAVWSLTGLYGVVVVTNVAVLLA